MKLPELAKRPGGGKLAEMLAGGALVLNFAAVIYAIWLHRPLFGDGSAQVFKLLEYGQTFQDGTGRYFTHVLQIPALLLRFIDANMDVIVRAYEAAISLHPFVSLFICFLIVKNKQRPDLMIFPLLSFALAGQISQAFAFGAVHEVLSIFWPAFLYFMTATAPKRKDEVMMTALLLLLAVTHEVAVFCFALFVILSWKKSGRFYSLTLGISLLALIWCLTKLWLFKVYVPSEFFEPDMSLQNSFPIIGILSLTALGVFLGLKKTKHPKTKVFFAGLAIFLPLLFIFSFGDATVWNARNVRGLSVPLAAVLALFSTSLQRTDNLSLFNRRIMYLTVTSLLITGSVRDFNISKNWNLACDFVKHQLKEQTGCVEIPSSVVETEIVSKGMRPPTLPLLSYLLVGNKSPTTILFEADSGKSCENLRNRRLVLLSKTESLSGNYFVLPK